MSTLLVFIGGGEGDSRCIILLGVAVGNPISLAEVQMFKTHLVNPLVFTMPLARALLILGSLKLVASSKDAREGLPRWCCTSRDRSRPSDL